MKRELHVHSHLSSLERWRHGVEIAAVTVAALWGFYVFIYQERIKPASEELRVQPTVELHHELLASGREYVEVRFTLKNISGRDARIAGMIVNVYGRRFGSDSGERIERPMTGITELNRTLVLSKPQLLYSFYDTWAPFGAPPGKINTLRPGQQFHEIIAFGIKPRSFDIAKINWEYCASESDTHWPVKRVQTSDGSYSFGNLSESVMRIRCSYQRRGDFFPL